ncbi:MAG TPA: hypothetical protein VHF69_08750, partial [Candidatus Synoicihabitans sp.]|nr:hypothetical protein [Candidatus Synoicihabitans sp.]
MVPLLPRARRLLASAWIAFVLVAPLAAAEGEEDEAPVGDPLALYAPEIVWTGHGYLAASLGHLYSSPDGKTWTKLLEAEHEVG